MIPLSVALALLRVVVAGIFLAHAIVRILNGSIPQFGKFLESQGFPLGIAWVWAITVFEISAGLLLIVNRYVGLASAGLQVVLVVGIALIHRRFGWFVGEHGTGGSEYSVVLMAALLVIAAAAERRRP
jgi:putative oxidoreductase